MQHQTKNISIMKEQFDCLVQRMTIEFRRLVTFAFHENNIPMINRLVGVYNTYQEEEREGVGYICDLRNKEDLRTCMESGLTAEEIAELVAKSFDESDKNYTTKFLCCYESNHLLMHSALKDTIISNATEIVEHMLKHPFCYDQDIYSKILTDHVE